MATNRKMIQMYVEQESSTWVTQVFPLSEIGAVFLDPTKKIVVREMTCEELGGIIGSGGSMSTVGFQTPFIELRILPVVGERVLEYFYGPSHVESPEVTKAGGALLNLQEMGFTASSLWVARRLAAHAYIDEVD